MIRVASLNMKNFNSFNKDINHVASVLRDCSSDIIVLQEVLSQDIADLTMNVGGLNSLRRAIGPYWEAKRVSIDLRPDNDPFLKRDRRGEGYAFLWNTQRIELLKDVNGKEILPCQFNDYKPGSNLNWLRRDPGYGRFKIKNSKIEIRIINVHIISEMPDKDSFKSKIPISDKAELRRSEFDVIAGKIYNRINNNRKDLNFNSVYTIIIGDYNLNLEGYGEDKETIQEMRCYDMFGNQRDWGFTKMKTVQSDLTTIKGDYSGYKNNFDHCSYVNDRKHSQAVGNCGRCTILDESDPAEKIEKYYKDVSDHLPIVVEINC